MTVFAEITGVVVPDHSLVFWEVEFEGQSDRGNQKLVTQIDRKLSSASDWEDWKSISESTILADTPTTVFHEGFAFHPSGTYDYRLCSTNSNPAGEITLRKGELTIAASGGSSSTNSNTDGGSGTDQTARDAAAAAKTAADAAKVAADAAQVTADAALPKAGGTLTGALSLHGAPTSNLHAATKKYVDDNAGGASSNTDATARAAAAAAQTTADAASTAAAAADTKAAAAQTTADTAKTTADAALPKAGGTLTGALTLAAAPTANLQAATKKYVDDNVATGGNLPTLPDAGDRDNKVAKFDGDVLKWERDASGEGGDPPAVTASIAGTTTNTVLSAADIGTFVVKRVGRTAAGAVNVAVKTPAGAFGSVGDRIYIVAALDSGGDDAQCELRIGRTRGSTERLIVVGVTNVANTITWGVTDDVVVARATANGEMLYAGTLIKTLTNTWTLYPGFHPPGGGSSSPSTGATDQTARNAAAAAKVAADAAQTSADDAQTTADAALPKAGGTMTGTLILNGAPTRNLHASTKKYVDDNAARRRQKPRDHHRDMGRTKRFQHRPSHRAEDQPVDLRG